MYDNDPYPAQTRAQAAYEKEYQRHKRMVRALADSKKSNRPAATCAPSDRPTCLCVGCDDDNDNRPFVCGMSGTEAEDCDPDTAPYPLHGRPVVTTTALVYGNPGENLRLPAGSPAVAAAATNIPQNSAVEYWLRPVGDWPADVKAWALGPGCGALGSELEPVEEEKCVQ